MTPEAKRKCAPRAPKPMPSTDTIMPGLTIDCTCNQLQATSKQANKQTHKLVNSCEHRARRPLHQLEAQPPGQARNGVTAQTMSTNPVASRLCAHDVFASHSRDFRLLMRGKQQLESERKSDYEPAASNFACTASQLSQMTAIGMHSSPMINIARCRITPTRCSTTGQWS